MSQGYHDENFYPTPRIDALFKREKERIEAVYKDKQRLFDFIKNDIMPLVAQQSGEDSERYRLAKMAYFVLRNRTVENWGPQELTMADAMRLP